MKAPAAALNPAAYWLAAALARESTLLFVLGLWLGLVQISIAASQIVLSVLVLLWLYQLRAGKLELVSLPLDRPLVLFAALSLASAIFSFAPAASLANIKKLVLLIVPYLVVSSLRRVATAEKLVLILIAAADAGALLALWQYFFGDLGDINHRIRGFMSHYMTFSGLLMGVGALALARLLFLGRPWPLLLASLTLIHLALALTLTRSAWLGVLAAAALLLFLRDRRLLVALPVLLAVAMVLVPPDVRARVQSFFQPDRSGQDRLYMLQSGLRMAAAHPWFGVGPDMVKRVYPIYRLEGAPHQENIHLHNNLAQIAAERGLPCLFAWLWLVGQGLVSTAAAYRRSAAKSGERSLAAGALALLVASLSAGLFEYNFGDSEFLMLFLFALALPFVIERSKGSEMMA